MVTLTLKATRNTAPWYIIGVRRSANVLHVQVLIQKLQQGVEVELWRKGGIDTQCTKCTSSRRSGDMPSWNILTI